ncbi:glycosyltransferase [Salinicoccus sp. RF5]|uniref:glycosyltransferase n=1 Tax=Salinicoccus sp. RF5 TaxID=2748874 RepID=UPI001E2EE810|nr:glycosyltransferase [Salinicoccus sp. RF5]MCC4722355.1 glycosyltransferase [Salinicoccus sp. RF5]
MKKKILFCIQNLDMGGPQKSLLSLLYDIDYKRYDVDLMIWSQNGSLKKYLPKEVKIVNLPIELSYLRLSKSEIVKNSLKMVFNGHHRLVKSGFLTTIKYRKNMAIGRQKFWEKNKKNFPTLDNRYDIAIAVSGGNLCYFISDCVSATKKYTWVRSDYRVFNRDKKIDKKYFSKVDGIITVSNICKDIMDEEFPEFSYKTHVFYNLLPFKLYEKMGKDTSQIIKTKNETVLLTISRLDPNKGLDLAVKAMKKLKSQDIRVKWYILGDGTYRKTLQKKIAKYDLENDFILLGFKNNTYQFIKDCDIFVHPSRFEGKSNAVDEAKYACKPIVVTNYPTVREQIINLHNGIIVSMSPEDLAEGIKEMMKNEELKLNCVSNLEITKNSMTSTIASFEQIINN